MAAKLKVGIIGCGGIARQKHFPALAANADKAEVVAFCDLIAERAQAACDEFGGANAMWCTDYHELLAQKDIDVVHVLTPNVAHSQITVDAFEAKKHVMCEKPMSHTAAEAMRMMAAWKKSGRHFTIGYQNRFRPEIQALYAACEAGELGDIYYAKAHAVRRKAVPTWGVFPDKSKQGGGPLIDIGTHALDITLWCMNNYEPALVSGKVFYKLGNLPGAEDGNMFGPWDPASYEVEDSAFGFIEMADGSLISLEAAWALNVRDSREAATTLCGTLAGAEVISGMGHATPELWFNRARHGQLMDEQISPATGGVAYFEGEAPEPGVAECSQWLDSIRSDTDALVLPEQAFVVTQILDAVYQADASGAKMRLGNGRDTDSACGTISVNGSDKILDIRSCS